MNDSIIVKGRLERESEYVEEAFKFLNEVAEYFIQNLQKDKKTFKLPIKDEAFFMAVSKIAALERYQLYVKRTWYSKKRVKIFTYDPYDIFW